MEADIEQSHEISEEFMKTFNIYSLSAIEVIF